MKFSQSFSKAIDIGCRSKRFSLDSLATMAATFQTAHEVETSEYRQTQAWVGGRSPVEAFYVAPPAKLVIPLVEYPETVVPKTRFIPYKQN